MKAPPPAPDPLVAEFLEYLRGERNAAVLTLRNYGAELAAFGAWHAPGGSSRIDWARIDSFRVRAYLVHLTQRRLERATIHLKMAALRSFYRWLVRARRVKQSPLVGQVLPKKPRKLPKFLTVQQVGALLEAPLKGGGRSTRDEADSRPAKSPSRHRSSRGPSPQWQAWRDKAMLETLYSAGLRIHELVQLNPDDVDLIGEVARVRGKGRKERLAPLGEPAVRAIQKYLDLKPQVVTPRSPAVFVNRSGGRMTSRSVQRMLK
ncbi:site-specific integrase, partial [bacterium]|nr:site-specific integrase [bacterium]